MTRRSNPMEGSCRGDRIFGSMTGPNRSATTSCRSHRSNCIGYSTNSAFCIWPCKDGFIWVYSGHEHYHFNLEEIFLFLMTKCKTGYSSHKMCDLVLGGHPMRWSVGYPSILNYLNTRYARTISHEKLHDLWANFPLSMMPSTISSKKPWCTISWMNQLRSAMDWTFFHFQFSSLLTAQLTMWADSFQGLMAIMLVLLKRLCMMQHRDWFIRDRKNAMVLKLKQHHAPYLWLTLNLIGTG